ncbi:MAG TPA: ankyrin repeat domain-containing protein [Humisphaera sp.]|jgi:hypothetical protein|nr:ankyrin repeat domain-containing protein [Humisphaera sp.]
MAGSMIRKRASIIASSPTSGTDCRYRRIKRWSLCLASLFCIAGALSCTSQPPPSIAKPAVDSPTGWDLVLAASGGELERVRYLVSHGVPVDGRYPADGPGKRPAPRFGTPSDDQLNWTALQSAAAAGHDDVVRYLLSVGANPNSADAYGQTSLYLAIELAQHPPTALALIKAHADVITRVHDIFEELDGTTPLHAAIRHRFPDVAVALAAAGADLTAKNAKGETPLDLADAVLAEQLKAAR